MSRSVVTAISTPPFRSVWRSVVGSSLVPVVLPEFDYLVLLGSSSTYQSFESNTDLGRQEHAARASMSSAGYDVPIISAAVSGSTVSNLDTNVNSYLTQLGPLSAANPARVAVVVNIGSNDIGTTSFAAMSQPTKDAMQSGIISIIGKIQAFGFTPILGTVHSRSGYAEMYEGWADGMYRPLVGSLTPFWAANPISVFDYCRLYLINKDVVNWWQVDGVHPLAATIPMQQYTAQQLGSKSILPAARVKDRVIFFFPASGKNSGGLNSIVAAASANLTTVYNAKGGLISGATFGWAGAVGSSGSVRTNLGAWNVALDHNLIQGCTLYGTASITFTAAFGVGFANRAGTLRVTASSSSAGRLTLITTAANSAVLNASGPGVQVVEVPFTMNASGTLVFTAAPQSPSIYANVSGVELLFD